MDDADDLAPTVVIRGGEIYAPECRGRGDVLLAGGRIAAIGNTAHAERALGGADEVVDATGCVVAPGFIDGHEHLVGGSGERGFATRTPEIFLPELVVAGITTVVGCLGVDTTTRTMADLLAKARGLRAEGLTAFIYSGGYAVPPVTLTGSIRSDVLLVPEVIGAGEIAVSDARSSQPSVAELIRLAAETRAAGTLSGKAGVTHLHVGDGPRGLRPIHEIIEEHDVLADTVYPTHVERSETLMRDAMALTRRGVTIDVDTVEEDLVRWLRFYDDHAGDPDRLTASSDAGISAPATLLAQLRACVVEDKRPLERVLALVTTNPARVLRLARRGRIAPGFAADVVVMRRDDLELVDVIARGRRLLRAGALSCAPGWVAGSNRAICVRGDRARAA